MKRFTSFLSGALFGTGLVVSGMVRPSKIIGFLDFFGDWDATLLFVMAGAVLVHAVSLRLLASRSKPLFESGFESPSRAGIDRRLLLGAGLFGLGWGAAGYCPGPAVVALASGAGSVILFFAAMLGGMLLFRLTDRSGSSSTCG